MLKNNCRCPSCLKMWGMQDEQKKGTRCTKCAKGTGCPNYDNRVLYGFCQSFEQIKKGGLNGRA